LEVPFVAKVEYGMVTSLANITLRYFKMAITPFSGGAGRGEAFDLKSVSSVIKRARSDVAGVNIMP
jgi:hypothetical protein